MNIFLAGTPVALVIPLVDRSGNLLAVDAISYRVVDHTGKEVVALTPLTGFTVGDTEAIVTVSGTINKIVGIPAVITGQQIDAFQVRETRTVELLLTIASNTILLNQAYALEPTDPLVVGINSFQTFSQAELCALDIPNLAAWNAASDGDKMAALVDARSHINQLNFWMMNSNANWGQDALNFVPEGQFVTSFAAGGGHSFLFNGNLALLTPTQFLKLPVRFLMALSKAQVAEADSVLGGDPVSERRKEGLLLESIGEVKQMYRSGKPLDLPVCKRALRYLSQFVSFSKRIGRG